MARTFADGPLLVDALEEAGCQEGSTVRYLRQRREHYRSCRVFRGLPAVEGNQWV